MKVLKRIIVWTLIPLIFEMAGLFFVDKFYVKNQGSFNIKKVDTSSREAKTKIKVKVPDDAENIKISHNGNYVSYYEDGSIYVVNTENNDKKEVDVDDDSDLSYYRWDLESDVILMLEKFTRGGSSYLKFVAYDAKRNSTEERKNSSNEPLEILLPDSSYEVKNVAFSGASNVTYVTSGAQGEAARIYRIDRMTALNKINFGGIELGNISAINNEDGDQVVYEDRSANRIRVGKRGDVIATGENAMHYLLGTDDDERVYIGNGNDDNINKIFVADLNKERSSWKVYNLSKQTNRKNIYVIRDGRICVNNPSENTVTEITKKKTVEYKGNLIGVYNYGVISRDGNKVLGALFD